MFEPNQPVGLNRFEPFGYSIILASRRNLKQFNFLT